LHKAVFSKAGGGQNRACPVLDTGGVWPLVVEASFCIDFLVTFSSRKKQLGLRGYERCLNFNKFNFGRIRLKKSKLMTTFIKYKIL